MNWWCATFGLAVVVGPLLSASGADVCAGDCNCDNEVTIEELVTEVGIAQAITVIGACRAGSTNGDPEITIDEIIRSVDRALNGCGGPRSESQCRDGCIDGTIVGGEFREDCDDGGICIGGDQAGAPCNSDQDCGGSSQPGVCSDGPKWNTACLSDNDCDGSTCVRCQPFGGDGCAANCTSEAEIPFQFVSGAVTAAGCAPNTSCVAVFGETIPVQPLPLQGMFTLTVGKEREGRIPVAVSTVETQPIPLSSIACACMRGVTAKTCGGTLFEADGAPALDCSEGYTAGDQVCDGAGKAPCAFVHGPGNAGSGVIGCQGLDFVDYDVTRMCSDGPGGPSPGTYTFHGSGPPGSAVISTALAIGTRVSSCAAGFCTEADPPGSRGLPFPFVGTTGTVQSPAQSLTTSTRLGIEFDAKSGVPFDCTDLSRGQTEGAVLAGAYVACNQPTTGDILIGGCFVAE